MKIEKKFGTVKWEQVVKVYLLKHLKANGNPEQGQKLLSRMEK